MFFRSKPRPPDPAANRPRAQRLPTAILTTPLGPVLDVSRTGLRIAMARKPGFAVGSLLSLDLESARDSLTVSVRVARVQSVGGGRYEIGVSLDSADEAKQAALEALARTGSTRSAGSDPSARERLLAALRDQDHYAVLGVPRDASTDQIRVAFRALARRLHPDVNKEPDAERRFALINDAHSVLIDEQTRAEYDQTHGFKRSA